jgi:leukotriene A-4 hydrolase/aminopeptidase
MLSLLASLALVSCTHKTIQHMPTLSAKNHSFANYDSVTLKHIHLDLAVDFDHKKLSGKAILNIDNHSGTQYLILDTKQLHIDKVLLEDKVEAAFSLGKEQTHLGQALVIAIEKNTKQVAVYYHTSPEAEALMWLSPEQTAGKKHPFLFTQSQAILARTWVPCMDAPAVRFTYSADITCDTAFLPLMSAQNNFEKNKQGKYHFEMPQPIPSYLLALAVGHLEFQSLGENCGVFAEPEMLEKSAYEFVDLSKMIAGASELYGEYAWGRYDVLVLPPSFPFGGMENPRITFATPTIIAGDRSLVSLIAHELAHSWSGNLVTNQTWDDFWLNEGFTVYFEERIMEKLYGKPYADMLSELSLGELKVTVDDLMTSAPGDTKLKLNLAGRNPDDGVTDIAYVKGCMFLKMIEEQVGRRAWDEFVKAYFNHFKFQTVTTDDFIAYLKENLIAKHPKANINYEEWIFNIGLPKNCPEINSTELKRVAAMAADFNNNHAIKAIDTAGFTTHHWLYLLRNLNADSIKNDMKVLDSAFNLTASTNAEIQCDWYVLCIKNNYQTAYPSIENYLSNVGRRKFLKPVYDNLAKTPEGLKFGKQIFEKVKDSYHAVSRNTIAGILHLQ